MYRRELVHDITQMLTESPAVAILGPRQVGKTTLAFALAETQPALYLDLENREDLQKLQNPVNYLGLHADKLVILDEIQHYPDLFKSLRGIIDARRRRGAANGGFLVLGSASNDLLQQSSESLAGRIHYAELTGLNPLEIDQPDAKTGGEALENSTVQGAVEAISATKTGYAPVQQLWLRGGFPNSYTARSDRASYAWRRNFIRTYLERDIPQLGQRIPATTLMRFWTMLAHNQGGLFNASTLAASLGVSSVTVNRYLDLMVDLLLVRRLGPWYGNVKKRLVKSPRIYVRDSGIVHSLLQIPNYESLLGNPIYGKSWEGFVVETVVNALPSGVQPFFYRTLGGAEIDLVIELAADAYWAVEIKASRTPTTGRGFHAGCDVVGVEQKFVIYTGDDIFPIGNDTTVLSLRHFIDALRDRAKRA